MDDQYWNLFWMTGMPSAWVLSHGRSEITRPPEMGRDSPAPDSRDQGDGQSGPY